MSETTVLTVEEVQAIRDDYMPTGSDPAIEDLCDSHEALRAEVERLTQDRDEWAIAAGNQSEANGKLAERLAQIEALRPELETVLKFDLDGVRTKNFLIALKVLLQPVRGAGEEG